jgi:hypothetical protein
MVFHQGQRHYQLAAAGAAAAAVLFDAVKHLHF